MLRALAYGIGMSALCTPCRGAERNSWNKLRYVGGTLQVKVSPYDYNTTLTVESDSILLAFARASVFTPQPKVRIPASQVISLSYGRGAWRRVALVDGAHVPAKIPTLFGLLADYVSVGIVYQADNGKRAAILLQGPEWQTWQILRALTKATGKPIEAVP